MRFLLALFAAIQLLLLTPASAAVQATLPPDQLVEQVSNDVLDEIRRNPQLAKANPKQLNELIDDHILPYSDFARMTRMAVGPKWRQASAEQKKQIQDLFRELLIAVYSGALKEVSDFRVQLKPNRFSDSERTVIIRTSLVSKSRDPIPLDYRLLKDGNQWKIFDVNVGGVWLIENYRSQFASVISSSGLDGLINQLKDRVAKLAH